MRRRDGAPSQGHRAPVELQISLMDYIAQQRDVRGGRVFGEQLLLVSIPARNQMTQSRTHGTSWAPPHTKTSPHR